MLILVRRRLLGGDFTSNLRLLQNYPPTNISHLLYVANKLRVRGSSWCSGPCFPSGFFLSLLFPLLMLLCFSGCKCYVISQAEMFSRFHSFLFSGCHCPSRRDELVSTFSSPRVKLSLFLSLCCACDHDEPFLSVPFCSWISWSRHSLLGSWCCSLLAL